MALIGAQGLIEALREEQVGGYGSGKKSGGGPGTGPLAIHTANAVIPIRAGAGRRGFLFLISFLSSLFSYRARKKDVLLKCWKIFIHLEIEGETWTRSRTVFGPEKLYFRQTRPRPRILW